MTFRGCAPLITKFAATVTEWSGVAISTQDLSDSKNFRNSQPSTSTGRLEGMSVWPTVMANGSCKKDHYIQGEYRVIEVKDTHLRLICTENLR